MSAPLVPKPPAELETLRDKKASGRLEPSLFDALLADPALPVDKAALEIAVRDMRRWTRRYIKPLARVVSLVSVFFIVALKRLLPFQFRWHAAIDVLCLWFMRRFVSKQAAYSLIRHFVVETQLINFVILNSGDADLPLCQLEPSQLADMGERTVIRHDENIYHLVLALGRSEKADVLRARPHDELDFSGLEVPEIDVEEGRRRWLSLDI